MYAKLYGSLLMSSIWAEDDATRIVWITLLALADREGYVFGSPAGVARLAGVSQEATDAALMKFEGPDEQSADRQRNPENEGRRIERVEAGGWRLLNYGYYRDLQREDDRKAQWRESKRKSRARGQSTKVSKSPLSESESESESESVKRGTGPAPAEPRRSRVFEEPTLAQVEEYAVGRGDQRREAEAFHAYYASNGWRVGKNPMRNWKAAFAGWVMRERERGTR